MREVKTNLKSNGMKEREGIKVRVRARVTKGGDHIEKHGTANKTRSPGRRHSAYRVNQHNCTLRACLRIRGALGRLIVGVKAYGGEEPSCYYMGLVNRFFSYEHFSDVNTFKRNLTFKCNSL